jgi:hypothetical protein
MLDDGSDFGRRKKVYRTTAERAAIVAESYEPGATVGGVACRHGIVASQLSSWRTAVRRKADQDKVPNPAFAEITLVYRPAAFCNRSSSVFGCSSLYRCNASTWLSMKPINASCETSEIAARLTNDPENVPVINPFDAENLNDNDRALLAEQIVSAIGTLVESKIGGTLCVGFAEKTDGA